MPSGDDAARSPESGRDPAAKKLRLVASVLGLLGAVLALAVPFMPVNYDVTTLQWPTAQGTRPVAAPLASYSPVRIDATVPCESARSLDARSDGHGTLVSTTPLNSDTGTVTGLRLQVDNGRLVLTSKGRQLGTAPLPVGNCAITVHSDGYRTTAAVGGQQIALANEDVRPQLTGVYSDLDTAVDRTAGLSFKAEIDTRYESHATALKIVVMAGAVLAFIGSVVVLRRLDGRAGRRPPRLVPSGWWKPTLRDLAVLGSLGVWWLIGAMTSDDGYILTIARAREEADYITNYYRWFAVPEAPFGWFYELYSLWVQVSTATPWVRLPALLMGITSWLLISREVLPRLGQQVRRSNAAGWAGAAVFLAFWMPYNNGLRSEPVVVLFSLLALCAVERAVATRRLMPAALGLVVAALAVGAGPTGLVAVLPYVAAIKPLFRLVRSRARQFGWLPVLAPIATCGFVIMVVVFSDQTWQAVMDATDLRQELGPNDHWYQELNRYNLLFAPTPDGSLVRRFPVLLVILCLATCGVMLLRRGRIRGAALGPSRRLLAVTALAFVVLVVTPTKWSHHFGLFAALGGALAALTALATSSTVLRSRRNRAAFFSGLMLIIAFAATGPNGWFYVSGWGVPWFDKPPSLKGFNASTALLAVAAVAAVVALIEHLRLDENNPKVVDVTSIEQRSRALKRGTAPLAIVCALLVVGEVATFAKVVQKQWGSYSIGADNVQQLMGNSCGLSDYVYVESQPRDGVLAASPQQPSVAAPGTKVPGRKTEQEKPNDYLRAKTDGFAQPGVPSSDQAYPGQPDWTPPHHFGDAAAPVWGSYDPQGLGTGELRTDWYDIPERATSGEVPVVVALAGIDAEPNSVVVEFGKDTARGFEIMDRRILPKAQGAPPNWRDSRLMVDGDAEGATKLRIVAKDQALAPQGWLALSAPRAPQLTRMTDFVGNAGTYVEWPAALVHPCLRIPAMRNGIFEMPKFRVAGGAEVRDIGQSWSSPDMGGPFGWMNVNSNTRELPTYLKNDISRDWGSLYVLEPQTPEALPAEAAMRISHEVRWGMFSPGPISQTVQLPGDLPSSSDRSDVKNQDAETDQ
ncbi:arabinosyltransferase domain-containing protein [Saccharopolyspora erythraea]|uniref:arabinosyltransferase domain-containing protein n=1 Tax=Saccharopolyspora erythraea TaxID=1836 RepID=UPI002011B7DB|nr:arabinosyltransferase domain-containing protein [Saccharopolyspora erythraea]